MLEPDTVLGAEHAKFKKQVDDCNNIRGKPESFRHIAGEIEIRE